MSQRWVLLDAGVASAPQDHKKIQRWARLAYAASVAELWERPIAESRFFQHFPAAYNAVHRTSFSGVPQRAGKLEQGWDYTWPNPTNRKHPLEVQHTAAASDGLRERAHPDNAASMSHEIDMHMRGAGHLCFHLSLDMDDTPRSRRFRQELTRQVCEWIDSAIAKGVLSGASARSGWNWQHGGQSSRIQVELRPLPPGRTKPHITGGLGSFADDTSWRLTEAVKAKSDQIGHAPTQTILVVEFDLWGLDDDDVHDLKTVLQGSAIPFREVWAVDLAEHTRILRVWP